MFSGLFKKVGKLPVLIGGVILILLLVGFLSLYFQSATLSLNVPTQKITKDVNVSASASSSAELALNEKNDTKDTEESATTTGKKTIGEKARGQVTVYNSSSSDKSFKSGTVIKSGNTSFTLDADINVDAASQSITSDGNVLTVTGKQNVTVTASDIGPDSNVNKDTKFQIEDFPTTTYFAIATSAFTGGTKKDIQTVSKDDIAGLEKKAIDSISTQTVSSSGNEHILDTLTQVSLTDEKLSHELGEEAPNVTLQAKAQTTYTMYDENAMKNVLKDKLSDSVSNGYSLMPQQISYTINQVKVDNDQVALAISATGSASINIDEPKLLNDIKGKNSKELTQILNNIYKVHDFTFESNSIIPFLKQRVPFFTRNIHLKLN